MAITIKIEPQIMQPTYINTMLVLDSDQRTQPNFQFRTIINVNGKTLPSLKHSSNLDGFGVIDLQRHLENEVSLHIPWTGTTIFQRAPHNYAIYDLELAELYTFYWTYDGVKNTSGKATFTSSTANHYFKIDSSITISSTTETSYAGNALVTDVDHTEVTTTKDFESGSESDTGSLVLSSLGTTVITGTTVMTPSTKYVFNGVTDWVDVPNWQFSPYLLTGSTSKFLTSLPTDYDVEITDEIWLNIYNGSGNTKSLEIISDNGKYKVNNSFLTLNDGNRFLSVGVGPKNLNDGEGLVIISGSTPVIPNSGSYTIQIIDTGGNPISELRTFNVVSNCSKYETYRMIFQDRLGSLIMVTFNRVSRKNIEVVKKNYRQKFGSYDPVNNTWGYNRWDRGKKRLDTIVRERYTITSNWVSEEVGNLIGMMIESSWVYHLDENNNIRAIDILTTSYESVKRVNNKIFNYQIDFEYSGLKPMQRG